MAGRAAGPLLRGGHARRGPPERRRDPQRQHHPGGGHHRAGHVRHGAVPQLRDGAGEHPAVAVQGDPGERGLADAAG